MPHSSTVLYFVQNCGLLLTPFRSVYLSYDLSKAFLAVILKYFVSAAVILRASLAPTVPFSLPYNRAERASVLCSFVHVFFSSLWSDNRLSAHKT